MNAPRAPPPVQFYCAGADPPTRRHPLPPMRSSYAKGFAVMGFVYSGCECLIEKHRARHDIWNAPLAGCAAGGIMAAPGRWGGRGPAGCFHGATCGCLKHAADASKSRSEEALDCLQSATSCLLSMAEPGFPAPRPATRPARPQLAPRPCALAARHSPSFHTPLRSSWARDGSCACACARAYTYAPHSLGGACTH